MARLHTYIGRVGVEWKFQPRFMVQNITRYKASFAAYKKGRTRGQQEATPVAGRSSQPQHPFVI